MYDREWVVEDLIPDRDVTLLTGDGGAGKSLLCLQLLVAAALCQSWVGQATAPRTVLGVFCEDDSDEIHGRTLDAMNHWGGEPDHLGDMHLMRRSARNNILMEFPGAFGPGETTAFFKHLLDTAVRLEAKLVVLDALHDLFAGNENNPSHVRQFVQALRKIATTVGGAVLVTAHPSLSGRNSGTGEPSSTAWSDAARSWLHLGPVPDLGDDGVDPNERMLTHLKSNYSRSGTQIHLGWDAGVFVELGTQKAKGRAVETFRPRCGR